MRLELPRAGLAATLILPLPLALSACEPEPEPAPSWEIGLTLDEPEGAFLSVWGPSPQEVYAVGGSPAAGVMYGFDGADWSQVELPEAFPLVDWVYGFEEQSGTVLWISGVDGMTARRDRTGSWETWDLGTESDLWGIWGSDDDDMYVVGGDVPGTEAYLGHWDGSAWTQLEIPMLDRELDALFKVWGTGADNVFAVGRSGVILHWDGSDWAQQPSGTTADLISLWGTGPNDIVAVGGRSTALVARYDGSSWSSEAIGMFIGLNGVWVDGEGAAFAVGQDGLAVEIPAGSFELTEVDRSTRPDVLHGAFGFDTGERFGVGGNLNFNPPTRGVILQYLP